LSIEKDNTRVTVEKTLDMVRRTKEIMKQRYQFGPDKVGMDNREARRQIQNMSEQDRQRMFNTMGSDQWDMFMEKIYNG
jgi:hypothetical protein